jgi:hypothetical protein
LFQVLALGKLEAREKLKSSGTVVLKLKILKSLMPEESKENVPSTLETSYMSSGADLAITIRKLINVEGPSLKLISNGQVHGQK